VASPLTPLPGPLDPATRSLLAGAFAVPMADDVFVARVMAAIAREAEKLQARLAAFQWTLLAALVLLAAVNAKALIAQLSFALWHAAVALAGIYPAAPLVVVAGLGIAAWLYAERA